MPHDFDLITRREHELPREYHEGLATFREHELRELWRGDHPGRNPAEFEHWRAAEPSEFKQWAEPHVKELIAVRERTMADRLQALEVARAENLNPGPAAPEAFGAQGANDLFKSMMGSGGGSEISQAFAAEVRSSAGDLEGVAGRVRETGMEAIISTYLEGKPEKDKEVDRENAKVEYQHVRSKFEELGSALREWNEAIAKAAEPKAAELEALAREVRAKVEACHTAIPAVVEGKRIAVTEGVVSAALDAISAEVARQWQARAGEPSFTGMAFRLSERPAGEKIAPDVAAMIKDEKYAGDYGAVWADQRDKLLEKIKDRKERNALKEVFKEGLGPNLEKWQKETRKLSEGKFSLKRMQESILGAAHATERYVASVEKLVKDPAVLTRFRDLLNGLQLQVRKEVALYRKWVTPK